MPLMSYDTSSIPFQVLRGFLLGAGQIPRGCQVRAGMRVKKRHYQTRVPTYLPPSISRNGIYPLMNFAAARPLGLPRVLAPPPEEAQKAKTPTPEPFDSETRKVSPNSCCTMLFLRVNHNRGMGASGDLSLSIPVLPQASRDQVQADHFPPEASCFYSPSPPHCVLSSIGFWPPPFPIWI